MQSLIGFLSKSTRRAEAPRRLTRFGRSNDGTTAVEFALVAAPFVGLMFAILETALVFFAQQLMETSVANAARLIRTGQAQQQSFSATQFRAEVCNTLDLLFDCTGGLSIDVRKFATFGDIDVASPLDEDGNLVTDDFTYDAGHGSDIVVVRAYYQWPVFVKFLGLDNMPDGKHLLAAAAAFRNEPFPW
jgi:Flp pilus assembly protein TadG